MKRFLKAVLHGKNKQLEEIFLKAVLRDKNKQLPLTFKSLPDVVIEKAEASMLNFM